MDPKEVLDELKTILVSRLKFEPRRAADMTLETTRPTRVERAEAALAVGAVGGGMLEAEAWYWERFRGRRPPSRPTPRSMLPFSHAEALGNALGLEGPRETLVMACSSGAASLALAADLIADGVVATALAGGVDALTRICFMGFNALKLLCPEPRSEEHTSELQ